MHKNTIFNTYKNDKEYQHHYKEVSDMLDIAIAIAGARRDKNLTQAQLAKKTGMPQSEIARIESGQHNVTVAKLSRISSALDHKVTLAARS